MRTIHMNGLSRRDFLKASAAAAVSLGTAPFLGCGRIGVESPMTRTFGRLDFDVTTLGLGGQASIQWTPADVDPVRIILKAFDLGVNYFDTSNLYGPSQTNFGRAFQTLRLIPGGPGYEEGLRRAIFLTSKTGLRYAKGTPESEGLFNASNGSEGSGTVDDVKRSLSQIFGDGHGAYPEGAYLDMVLMHNVTSIADVDAVYEGYDGVDPEQDRVGALAALRDLRDGTNFTGLNPGEEKLIRNIGFSGHHSPPVMIEMLQRDVKNDLAGMLIAINANDRLNFNMQHNAIPIASAKGMGIIGMKLFADGAMYSKGAHWSTRPEHVVRTVGAPGLPSRPLVEYALTTPGIHTAIIGIGQIDEDPAGCQLAQNLSAAQVTPNGLTPSDRTEVEQLAAMAKSGETNYFQIAAQPLGAPRDPRVEQEMRSGERMVHLYWQTAFAGRDPLARYEIWRDEKKTGEVAHQPQTTKLPFSFEEKVEGNSAHSYRVVSVDVSGASATTEAMVLPAAG